MRAITRGVPLGAVLLMLSMGAASASAQTVDEVVEKAVAAEGGREALAKIKSRSIKGNFSVAVGGGEFSGPVESVNEAPNKQRTLVTLDLSAAGMGTVVIDERFNGTSGYRMDSMQGNAEVTGTNLENMRNSIFPSGLIGYKEIGTKIELAGKEKVGTRDAFVLLATPKTGPPSKTWIDAETYLPLKAEITADAPGMGPIQQTMEFSDYREVDGVKVAHVLKGITPVSSFTITITKVEHNVKIDPALFSKPTDK